MTLLNLSNLLLLRRVIIILKIIIKRNKRSIIDVEIRAFKIRFWYLIFNIKIIRNVIIRARIKVTKRIIVILISHKLYSLFKFIRYDRFLIITIIDIELDIL